MKSSKIQKKAGRNTSKSTPFFKPISAPGHPLIMKNEPDQGQGNKKVTTLCHRDFVTSLVPGSAAQHCFSWGHPKSTVAIPANIIQDDTITYDNKKSGTKDDEPQKNTVCTRTFEVDPTTVKNKYKELCDPKDYNLVSFNCCTCAYLALAAAGAKLKKSDFPKQNDGIGLPKSYGYGLKRYKLEKEWWNDIDELEGILDKYTLPQIRKVPLEMKASWIKDMMRGTYTTENEGKIIIKLFRGTPKSKRPQLYQMVEGHPWSGDWKEGVTVIDDNMVDHLYRSQLNELKDVINGKK